jgi:hypothetical protein
MIQRWNNRPFTISLDLSAERGQLIDSDGKPVDCVAYPAGCEEGECVTLTLDCQSTGYYDPGRLTGPYEDCYPPEGEDERDIVSATLTHPAGVVEIRDRSTLDELYSRFQSRIEAEEVSPDDDYEDFDDYIG